VEKLLQERRDAMRKASQAFAGGRRRRAALPRPPAGVPLRGQGLGRA